MTREKAIEQLEPLADYFDAHVPAMSGDAIRFAVSALRFQQTPANLDRNRWEGCDICTKKLCSTCHFGNFFVGRPCLDCHSGSLYKEMRRNFCSNCGRPLTEEAWAEMERRVNGETN